MGMGWTLLTGPSLRHHGIYSALLSHTTRVALTGSKAFMAAARVGKQEHEGTGLSPTDNCLCCSSARLHV